MNYIELIESKGFIKTRQENGSNEFRTWTIYYFSHPNGSTLMFDDSRLLVVVRKSGHVVHEGKVNLNFKDETF